MKQIKQWHLSFFGANDLAYIRDLECGYEVNDSVETVEINAPNGQMYHYLNKSVDFGLYITTDDEKKEAMLRLKYGGDMKLMRVFYVNEWGHRFTSYEF
jgi:hypothetical protein